MWDSWEGMELMLPLQEVRQPQLRWTRCACAWRASMQGGEEESRKEAAVRGRASQRVTQREVACVSEVNRRA